MTPEREGYTFLGRATEQNYTLEQPAEVEDGTGKYPFNRLAEVNKANRAGFYLLCCENCLAENKRAPKKDLPQVCGRGKAPDVGEGLQIVHFSMRGRGSLYRHK